jgi:deoxycytidine triphosphate deaminase
MSLLRDHDLIENINGKQETRYFEGVELPADPYAKESPIQASSIDLHIGEIFLPGTKKDQEGGVQNPKSGYSLQTGETAVVTTKETLHFPGNIAGFGFPPSRVSFKGLLMTNPGHVDPGYNGVMRFTVINMAKEAYHLAKGDRIVRLLLFKMNSDADSDWKKRNPEGSHPPTQAEINLLSKDFVNVERRAKRIAKEQGVKAGLIITSVLGLVGLLMQAHLFYRQDVEDLKKRQEMLDYDLKNRVDIERKLQEFDNRLKELERLQTKPSSGGKGTRSITQPIINLPGKNP